MSVAPSLSTSRHWLLPTCGQACHPGDHDPRWHEAVGMLTALRTPPATIVRTGPLTVDLVAERVYVHGAEISLSEREWGVLAYYARNAGRPCAHDDVLASVWGPEYVTGVRKARPGRSGTWNCDRQMLSVTLVRLRAKLGDARSLLEVDGRGKRRLRLEPADA